MSSQAQANTSTATPIPPTNPAGTPSVHTPPAFDFLDLKAQFATIRGEVMDAIAGVMESQQFILGREVRLLEEEVAARLGASHAVSCASGSDALLLAMMAAGIGPYDEVITTPFTFFATAGSIARLGAIPVFVDIDPETLNIDPNALERAITPRTRAIMPVHLFGLPAEMDPILELARARGLAVVEDAAQAIGARYRDRSVGTVGTFGCFSFFPSKNLGGAGDGGLITSEDAALAELLRRLRAHGSLKKYHHELLGINSRLDALQAAILRVKLRYLDQWMQARQHRAGRYHTLFEEIGLKGILLPQVPSSHVTHVYNQFVIRSTKRDALREYLRGAGIPTEIYYPVSLHLQPAFAYLGYKAGDFPHSELASRQALALPVYPELTDSQQQAVVNTIAAFYSQASELP
ncbi:MAG: DegT/DnrJ/EryC1/StrS family aminotransferase [Candidatus Acidiferrales bacterium]